MSDLVNFPRIRIKKYIRGYVVESNHYLLGIFPRWKHVISVSGIPSEPWYYSSYDTAVSELSRYLIDNINYE